MKYLVLAAVALGVTHVLYPGGLPALYGRLAPSAPASGTSTGTPAPLSNPTTPTTIGALNISGSRFGRQRTTPQNSVV